MAGDQVTAVRSLSKCWQELPSSRLTMSHHIFVRFFGIFLVEGSEHTSVMISCMHIGSQFQQTKAWTSSAGRQHFQSKTAREKRTQFAILTNFGRDHIFE